MHEEHQSLYKQSMEYSTLQVESQNFLDPVLANLSLSIKLSFKNTDLG
jgi:hypothetical protein